MSAPQSDSKNVFKNMINDVEKNTTSYSSKMACSVGLRAPTHERDLPSAYPRIVVTSSLVI